MAYDLVQQRDAGTKARVSERQVIKTIEDQHKYDMPDQRRLYVTADAVNMPVPVQQSGVNRLATALADVKPQILDYLAENQATKNAQLYEQGKMDAMSGKDPAAIENEWQKKGYDYLKSTNDWTAWNEQVTNEYTNNFDKDTGDINQFLTDKWNAIDWESKTPDYKERFTKLAAKTFDTTRADHSKYMVDKQEQELDATISQTFYDDIKESVKQNGSLSIYDVDARVKDLQDMFPGRGMSQLNLLAYSAVDRIANDIINDPNSSLQDKSNAIKLYDVFKENYPNGTPGLYATKHRETIDRDYNQAVSAYNSAVTKQDQQTEKALKELGQSADRHVDAQLLQIMTTTEGDVRATKLQELTNWAIEQVNKGVPLSTATLNTLRSVGVKDINAADTKEQALNYADIRSNLGKYSSKYIHMALERGDISLSGFNQLLSAKEAADRRDEQGNGYTKLAAYKAFKADVKVMMGYHPYDISPNSEEKNARVNLLLKDSTEEIEDLIDSGVKPEVAVTQVATSTKKRMVDLKLVSETFTKAQKELNSDKRQTDPWAYYSAGNGTKEELIADKAKLTPSQYSTLQQQMLIRAQKSKQNQNNGTRK